MQKAVKKIRSDLRRVMERNNFHCLMPLRRVLGSALLTAAVLM